MTPEQMAQAVAQGMELHAGKTKKVGRPDEQVKLGMQYGLAAGGSALAAVAGGEAGKSSAQKELKMAGAGFKALFNAARAAISFGQAFAGSEGSSSPAAHPIGLSGGPGGRG